MTPGKKEARQLPPAGLSAKNTKRCNSAQLSGQRQTRRRVGGRAWLALVAIAATLGGLA